MAKPIQFHILNTLSQALSEIFEKSKRADHMIDKYSRANRNWSPEERHFFAQGLYDIVRNKRKLEFIAGCENSLQVIGAYLASKNLKAVSRPELENADPKEMKARLQAQKPPAIEHSFPDWLFQIGQKEFAVQWPKIMQGLNQEPAIFLRANTLKTNIENLSQNLKAEKIETVKIGAANPDGIYLKERKNVFATQAFKNGDFEMQDAGSQMIAPLLQVEPGQDVADTCAGTGGKSLHLAALMKNQGKIVALDIMEEKLSDLRQRATRAGAGIITTQLIDSPKVISRLENSFDRVLIDAPCSGLGVLRRNPDSKWKLNPQKVSAARALQREILSSYSALCKSGGLLVYATCSILKRENEEQISWFLKSKCGKKWSLLSEHRMWPHVNNSDGFYAAVLKKT